MKIIAHRGFWLESSEKNSLAAFERALKYGFGIETDFRDHNGRLVIAHDLPVGNIQYAQGLSDLLLSHRSDAVMALNIKSDGLHRLMADFISNSKLNNYFVFDMSVPDMRGYLNQKINAYSRLSEYELTPNFLDQCSGVWLDCFEQDIWYGLNEIQDLISVGKNITIVSPELHGRPHLDFWYFLKNNGCHLDEQIAICTDYPLEAGRFFNEKN